MNPNIKISVVIPVWNPGEGIIKCLSSLRNQTFEDLEFIFVDDRGSDDAMEIIRKAEKEDSRIRVLVNPENMGPGYSRNRGIESAAGQYMSFIDPDDYIAPDFYELLYKKAVESGADIIKGSLIYEKEDGSAFPHHSLNDMIRSGIKAGKPYYALYTYEHHGSLFRRKMLLDAKACYGLARRAQDTTFLLKACSAADSMALEDRAVYFFCERHSSAMHLLDIKSLDQRLFSFQEQVDYLVEHKADDPYAVGYCTGIFLSALRFFACYEIADEAIPAVQNYAEGMRRQIMRLKFSDELKKRCFPVRALSDYSILLPSTPGYMPWEQASADGWTGIVSKWTGFYLEHPETFKSWMPAFYMIVKKAEEALKNENADERLLSEELNKLPDSVRRTLYMNMKTSNSSNKMPGFVKSMIKKLIH